MSATIQERWAWDNFATTDASSSYVVPIVLPEGHLCRITEFGVNAMTNYAAQDTNYQTFSLCDKSGNVIATVANGPSATGLAIGPLVTTGIDTDMDDDYATIDCTDGPVAVYVKTAATGAGRAMERVSGWIKYSRVRA